MVNPLSRFPPLTKEQERRLPKKDEGCVVYSISNPADDFHYIGYSCNCATRFHHHKVGDETVPLLYSAIKACGWDNMKKRIIGIYQDRETAKEVEIEWVEKVGCLFPNGMCKHKGGNINARVGTKAIGNELFGRPGSSKVKNVK